MKKTAALFLAILLLMTCCAWALAAAEEDGWKCPSCGAAAAGNFCSKCGEKRPDDGTWICPDCGAECTENFCSNCGTGRPGAESQDDQIDGKLRLDLNIAFEKNAYFSKYDVRLYVDDEWITTMRHGSGYAGTLYVVPGKHAVIFQEDSSSHPAKGGTIINIAEPTLYQCGIHAKRNAVQITSERTETISGDEAAPDDRSAIMVDGGLKLRVSIEFRKNGIFSQYDVDMYCDDILIATLPNGRNYEGTLLVSKGSHMISFVKSGSSEVRGTCRFKVDRDASFSCNIEAERNKVDVRNDRLTY